MIMMMMYNRLFVIFDGLCIAYMHFRLAKFEMFSLKKSMSHGYYVPYVSS